MVMPKVSEDLYERECVVLKPCETFEWSTGEWTECPFCNNESRTRSVDCIVSNGTTLVNATEDACYNAGEKPHTTESCLMGCADVCQHYYLLMIMIVGGGHEPLQK